MIRLTRARRATLCAVVAALIYFAGLGRPALWEPDEGRYAEVAREMVVSGDYVTPRNDWVRYFEKPPLVYWATAGSLRLFGHNEFAVRLQAALFSAGQVATTAVLGEEMFGIAAGLFGAMALALSPLFFAFARFATPDPALALFFTAALACFWMAARPPGFDRHAARAWMVAAAAMLALGTLAKGPVALVLGGGVALVWLIVEGRLRDALKIPWLRCAAIYLAITVPWFVLAATRNPGFVQFFFVHEHLHRYLENTEHGWGPWFFVPVIVGGTWPWIFFAPLGLDPLRLDPIDADSANREGGESPLTLRSALKFLLIWFGLVVVFFSIPRSKLGEYILPALPALAMVMGHGLARLGKIPAGRARRMLAVFVICNAALALAAVAAVFVIGHRLGATIRAEAVAAAVALFSGAAAAFFICRDRPRPMTAALPIAIGVLLAMGAMTKAREDAAPMASYRTLAGLINPYLGEGCVLASYRHQIQSLPFYTGVREALVAYRGELAPFGADADAAASFIPTDQRLQSVWSSSRCMVIVANRVDLVHLESLLSPAPSIIGCEGKKFALYNQPVRSAPALSAECGTGNGGAPPGASKGLGSPHGHL